jgi:hypothetical protein
MPSLLSSLLFIVGALLFAGVALVMGVTALGTLFTGQRVQAQQTIVLMVSVFETIVLIVAAFISIQKYRQQAFVEQDASFSIKPWQVAASLVFAAVVILIGYLVGGNDSFNWLVLPLLTLPAVILPLFILLGFGIRGIPLGTRWQSWSVFGVAMTLAPFILIVLEATAFIVIVILIAIFLLSQPSVVEEMQELSRQFYLMGPQPEDAQRLLLPYITNPGVLAVALAYFSVVVPMMEELFKPLGVWLFGKRLSSPAQGFALGALSGAAYALIETLGVSAQTADWASLLLSRIGTGMLHITTSALMGAAIVYAVKERRYLRLFGTYLLAISLHGLWNALAILVGFAMVAESLGEQSALVAYQTPLVIAMSILAVILFAILILSNRRMRKRLPQPVLEQPTP